MCTDILVCIHLSVYIINSLGTKLLQSFKCVICPLIPLIQHLKGIRMFVVIYCMEMPIMKFYTNLASFMDILLLIYVDFLTTFCKYNLFPSFVA